MAHPKQILFLQSVLNRFPQFRKPRTCVEIGSQDVNGSIREIVNASESYVGVDIELGKGVDFICPGELLELPDSWSEITISTECFEHAEAWQEILKNAIRMTKTDGMILITCAGIGREAHGTIDSTPHNSPLTNAYYKNVSKDDITSAINLNAYFHSYSFEVNSWPGDTYFWGIRSDFPFKFEEGGISLLEHRLSRAQGQSVQLFSELSSAREEIQKLNAKIKDLEDKNLLNL